MILGNDYNAFLGTSNLEKYGVKNQGHDYDAFLGGSNFEKYGVKKNS